MNIIFVSTSIFLGIGLAVDAFSVSMVNGLNEPKMRLRKVLGIALTFAGFQFLMPLIGWFLVHTAVEYFKVIEPFIPWVALILMCFIGGKMLYEGIRGWNDEDDKEEVKLGKRELFVQGVATSIDALSVGFAIADYDSARALVCSAIVGVVTFIMCSFGVKIGSVFGTKLEGKASVIGGVILICIGIAIVLRSF